MVQKISSTYKKKTEGGNPSSVNLCGLVTDFRTFYNDYLMVVKFFEWLKEKAEG